jgi:tRNA-specific 2-thiouridylase
VLAVHGGVHRFTVGQRKGLGLPSSATGKPMYVLALRPAEHQVVVGPRSSLERTTLTASEVNWIGDTPRRGGALRATVQIRHRHLPAAATVRALDGARAEVTFDTPQIAITPGQAVVFYDEDVVVGGGWIEGND